MIAHSIRVIGDAVPNSNLQRYAQWVAIVALLLLIVLCLGWELWWAPLRAGGSFLVLKTLPLLLPLRGLLQGRRYTAQWSCLFILIWLAEGLMRGWSDSGLSRYLAQVEVLLSLACFTGLLVFARALRR